jgi:hypothetical protein
MRTSAAASTRERMYPARFLSPLLKTWRSGRKSPAPARRATVIVR